MNFFGHAVAASWVSPSPAFALGAMLPDLADMIASNPATKNAATKNAAMKNAATKNAATKNAAMKNTAVSGAVIMNTAVTDPVVAKGVRFHHLTDRCFHQDPTFRAMEADARHRLNELGVRKGTRWGVAHVGLELLLDRLLFQNPAHRDAYFDALKFGASLSDEDAPLAGFCRTLLDIAERLSPDTPEQLTDRLVRVFSRRPALAVQPPDVVKVAAWARHAFPDVESRFEVWIAELEANVRRAHGAEGHEASPMTGMASGPLPPSRGRGVP